MRYRVFHDELGARLTSRIPGLDCDFFDPYCEHLIVRDRVEQRVVGCYRVLTPEGAERVGGLYSEQEYDLVRLDSLRERMVEVGRACIAPGHRHGGVIALLFAGLASYLDVRGYRYLFGLASVPLHGGIDAVHALFAAQWAAHAAPIEYRVTPRQPLPEVGGRRSSNRRLARRSSRLISTRGRGCVARRRWMRISSARTCRFCCRPSAFRGAMRGIFGQRWRGSLPGDERRFSVVHPCGRQDGAHHVRAFQ